MLLLELSLILLCQACQVALTTWLLADLEIPHIRLRKKREILHWNLHPLQISDLSIVACLLKDFNLATSVQYPAGAEVFVCFLFLCLFSVSLHFSLRHNLQTWSHKNVNGPFYPDKQWTELGKVYPISCLPNLKFLRVKLSLFYFRTALMFAARDNFPNIVTRLLQQGADVSATDFFGRTAKDFARYKHLKM